MAYAERWLSFRERGQTRDPAAVAGTVLVSVALLSAVFTCLVLAGMTPIQPTSEIVAWVLLGNAIVILLLVGLIASEWVSLRRARRAGAAGARLHGRIVRWFGFIAALPTALVAIVASVTLERGLDPWFATAIRDVLTRSVTIAEAYKEAQCRMMTRETSLMANDLNRIQPAFDADRRFFRDYMSSRAFSLGLPVAVIVQADLVQVEQVEFRQLEGLLAPALADIEAARDGEPYCLIPRGNNIFRVVLKLSAYPDLYLFTARPVDPGAIEFPPIAETGLAFYRALEGRKSDIQVAFASMFALVALIVLVSSMWLGLSFANRLVAPVRRLIHATDQVASGNFYVQVPVGADQGDLDHLGATFNKMTSELRVQHDNLRTASDLMDRRRRFTEAVLSGVSSGVIGLDARGRVTVLNPSAEKLLSMRQDAAMDEPLDALVPELHPLLVQAQGDRNRPVQGQVALSRDGVDRQLNIRVTTEQAADREKGYVVTIDDITELVLAQRTSAWADVARRIAHEIKNPLTPIQLSAERIRRKYGKVITADREIFDQCTATIIRQVDDIKRMVDEFSSFAQMPKPRPEAEDVVEIVRQVVFLMRMGHPDIEIREELPLGPVIARFDRRLVGQAVTNIVKNAAEAVGAVPEEERGPGVVTVRVGRDPAADTVEIDVFDNGKGFPKEHRQRLLEPYMTTREGGTGLGLAIVGKILEDHGGGIQLLDNPEGRGGRVLMWFAADMPAVNEGRATRARGVGLMTEAGA